MNVGIGEPGCLEITHQYVGHSLGAYIVYGADLYNLLEDVVGKLLIVLRRHGVPGGGRSAAASALVNTSDAPASKTA